jgi:hypoxanthine phosphoribosyltransferase
MPVVRGKIIEPLFSPEAIAERNQAMAAQIAASPKKDLLVISILKGSFIFAADLIRSLHAAGLEPEVEFITLSSYGKGHHQPRRQDYQGHRQRCARARCSADR